MSATEIRKAISDLLTSKNQDQVIDRARTLLKIVDSAEAAKPTAGEDATPRTFEAAGRAARARAAAVNEANDE